MWPLLPNVAVVLLVSSACAEIIIYTPDVPHLIVQELRDLPAEFGPELPLEGVKGMLVVGEPRNGCAPLPPPPAADNFTKNWIVLVARYNCSFEDKVRNAQKAGYDCAIVHNVDSNDLENMSVKNPEGIEIPSVFVGADAGGKLAKFNYTTGYYIMVNSDSPFDFNTHLLLPFAIVVVLCLLVILIFMIVKCIKDRRRARRHRLPNRCLKKIPTCKFSKGDPYDTCAICLDDYQEGDKLRVLPCAHAYHMRCIDPWLTENRRVCPVCKRKVFAAGERRTRASSDSDTDDTEPLVSEPPTTQGGTFDEQSENPFRRAERFMQRLRAARSRTRAPPAAAPHTQEEASQVETEETNNENEDHNATADDTAPLLAPVVTSQSERGRRTRSQRRRRARSSPRAAPAPAADHRSINGESQQPYIGVAALPAPTHAGSAPHHVDL